MDSPIYTTNVLPAISPSVIKQTERNWVIGMILGAILYGVLITVGIASLKALYALSPQKGILNQRTLLISHVSLLLLLNTALQAKSCQQNFEAIFNTPPDKLTYFYLDQSNIMIILLFGLTDGLLVWRCYMVQEVLLDGRSARWNHLCWIFPLLLWMIGTGTGMVAVVVSNPHRALAEEPEPFPLILLLISTSCNMLLNLFATANIITRLLIHRRTMIKSFGRISALTNVHLKIVGIMLESAIINLPTAIVAVTCALLVGGFGLLAWDIGVPAQSFSSVLVIYQVATGRAIGSRRSEGQQLDTMVSVTDTC